MLLVAKRRGPKGNSKMDVSQVHFLIESARGTGSRVSYGVLGLCSSLGLQFHRLTCRKRCSFLIPDYRRCAGPTGKKLIVMWPINARLCIRCGSSTIKLFADCSGTTLAMTHPGLGVAATVSITWLTSREHTCVGNGLLRKVSCRTILLHRRLSLVFHKTSRIVQIMKKRISRSVSLMALLLLVGMGGYVTSIAWGLATAPNTLHAKAPCENNACVWNLDEQKYQCEWWSEDYGKDCDVLEGGSKCAEWKC